MNRVVHFEIHAEQPERAIKFYQSVFGWKFQSWGEGSPAYWLIETGPADVPGINGGLISRRGKIDGKAVIAYVCTVEVDSVDRCAEKIAQQDGQIVVPKSAIPGVGWLVYAKDTEGNIFGIMENDTQAG